MYLTSPWNLYNTFQKTGVVGVDKQRVAIRLESMAQILRAVNIKIERMNKGVPW